MGSGEPVCWKLDSLLLNTAHFAKPIVCAPDRIGSELGLCDRN